MERGSCEILPGDSSYLFKVLQNDTSRKFQVCRVERCRYRQETLRQTNLSLDRRNTILAQYGWRFDHAQAKIKSLEGLGRTGYDNVPPPTINQVDVDIPILGQMRIGNIIMVLALCLRQVWYRRHGRWSTFTLIDGVLRGARGR